MDDEITVIPETQLSPETSSPAPPTGKLATARVAEANFPPPPPPKRDKVNTKNLVFWNIPLFLYPCTSVSCHVGLCVWGHPQRTRLS